METIKITCYGPRGSRPSASRKGFSTVEYGGDTNCYYVEAGPFRIIIDDGTGVAVLGEDLMAKQVIGKDFINLISHYHWDHIQGLPFCDPYFIGSNKFHIHGLIPSGHEASGQPRTAVEMMLAIQQANPHFPVAHECLPAKKRYTGHDRQFSSCLAYVNQHYSNVGDGEDYHRTDSGAWDPKDTSTIKITTIPLNHPDGCLGYRIDWNGISMAYCTDLEPFRKSNSKVSKLAKGVDWILLDGQYTEEEIGGMQQGFGHGTPFSCVEQATACEAKFLVVSHFDPRRDDSSLAKMERQALEFSEKTGFKGKMEFAKEGRVWTVSKKETVGEGP